MLFYTFLSLAVVRNTPHGKMVPVEGMKLIAALAHKHGVPVTWIVDSHSVQESRKLLTQWHQECGDDVILLIDTHQALQALKKNGTTSPASKAEEIVILRQNLPGIIISEREKIRDMLPWADVIVASADTKTEVLVEVLEELNFIGLWGYCWREVEQAASLRENKNSQFTGDTGCPWSFFYASRDYYSAPAQYSGGLVAVESTSLNLNAAFYSDNSRFFSAEPGALRTFSLYADKNLAYPRAIFNEYLRNSSWNRFTIFVQQQPAYQMEYASYNSYDRGFISDVANIMDDFFREVVSNSNIQALSLPQAINLYKGEFKHTESCCMAFDSILPLNADIDLHISPVPKQKPPFTFFYYDRECQLIFKEGQMPPIEMRNYFRPPFESSYYLEKEMPSMSQFRPSRDRDRLIMEFEIDSVKQMPFGLAIWDDHSMFSLVSTNARFVKWIGTHLLFIRVDLEEGLNRVEVSLTI